MPILTHASLNLASRYRPRRFEDVVGQERVVKRLSELAILRATRNILLSGAYGSGKTSLIKILAKAWNCDHLSENGSPCQDCWTRFENDRSVLFEYDVTGKGGNVEQIREILRELNRTPHDHRVRVVFFDEAHALTLTAADALLKAIEEPAPGVSFCFATTQSWKLSAPLRSRLFEMSVRPLSAGDAVGLLRHVASDAGISCDTEGLVFLAGLKRGHPRDLLSGLEHVAMGNTAVTFASVKECFDIDQDERVVAYFLALAAGDQRAQQVAIDSWRDQISVKISWIRAFLLSLYYRDVLGESIVIDAVTHAISYGRAEIIRQFCARLAVENPLDLAPYWRRILSFWLLPTSDDEIVLRIRLTLFEDLVNRGLDNPDFESATALPSRALDRPETPNNQINVASPHVHPQREGAPTKFYFQAHDVRLILNRASFFAQHHGRLMNASIFLTPTPEAMKTEESAVDIVKKFVSDLNDYSSGGVSASVTVFDSGEAGVVGRIVAHVPVVQDKLAGIDSFSSWCRGWLFNGDRGHDVDVKVAKQRNDVKFHWRALAKLAAGMGDSDDLGSVSSLAHNIISALKISPAGRRYQGALGRPVVDFSASLNDAAVERACANGMSYLSAIDDAALTWVMQGWELDEYKERSEEIRVRERALAELDRIHGDDKAAHDVARSAKIAEWPTKARMRPRRGSYWWNSRDA